MRPISTHVSTFRGLRAGHDRELCKNHRCKKVFLRFLFWSRFFTFFDFFIFHFPDVFFIFKKRWQSSEHLQEFENQ